MSRTYLGLLGDVRGGQNVHGRFGFRVVFKSCSFAQKRALANPANPNAPATDRWFESRICMAHWSSEACGLNSLVPFAWLFSVPKKSCLATQRGCNYGLAKIMQDPEYDSYMTPRVLYRALSAKILL